MIGRGRGEGGQGKGRGREEEGKGRVWGEFVKILFLFLKASHE